MSDRLRCRAESGTTGLRITWAGSCKSGSVTSGCPIAAESQGLLGLSAKIPDSFALKPTTIVITIENISRMEEDMSYRAWLEGSLISPIGQGKKIVAGRFFTLYLGANPC
jgi:hypothetical protein